MPIEQGAQAPIQAAPPAPSSDATPPSPPEGAVTAPSGASASTGGPASGSPEGGEAKVPAAPPAFDLFGDDTPESLRPFEGAPAFSITEKELAALPPEMRHLAHNFRSRFLEKTRSLAAERKKFDAQVAAWEKTARQQGEELARGRARLIDFFGDERIKKLLTPPEEPKEPLDPYSPEGLAFQMQKYAREEMSKFLGEFNALGEEEKKKVEALRAENKKAERIAELEAFAEAHPDFEPMADEIKAYREKFGRQIPAEEVYQILVDRKAKAAPPAPPTSKTEARRASSSPVRASTGGGKGLPKDWHHMNGAEMLAYIREHPDEFEEEKRALHGR